MLHIEEIFPENFPPEYESGQLKYYRITDDLTGMEVMLTNMGASVLEIKTRDRTGTLESIVKGFSSFDEFMNDPSYRGRTIGRWANRIKKGIVALPRSMQGRKYILDRNENENTLHGGNEGWSHKAWDVINVIEEEGRAGLVFRLKSEDGDMGFPGNVDVLVSITLAHDAKTEENELRFSYAAATDKNTFINMTFHGYFDLEPGSLKKKQELTTNASQYLELKSNLPTGKIIDVAGTGFDFSKGKPVGYSKTGFYDDCLVFPEDEAGWAKIYSSKTGRYVHMTTTEKSFQLYTGNPAGIALEAQKPVNCLNMPEWKRFYIDAFTTKQKPYLQQTIYRFGIDSADK